MAERIQVVTVGVVGPAGAGVGSHEDESAVIMHVRQVTSGTRPSSPIEGQVIYETDTDRFMVWDGSVWVRYSVYQKAVSVKAVRTTNQSINHASGTSVSFTGEDWDTDSAFTATSTTITIPVSGLYRVDAYAEFALDGTGVREILVLINGTGDDIGNLSPASGSIATRVSASGMVNLNSGDTLALQVYQNRGSALNLAKAALSATSVGRV